MKLDVIVPAYNEEGSILKLYETLTTTLSGIKYNIIFVNDGSSDNTFNIMKKIYLKDKKHVKVINFSRNFGKDAGIYCGLLKSTAKYVALIDADMQQPPKYLIDMTNILDKDETIDEVAMVNQYQNYSVFQQFAKKLFYSMISKLSGLKFKIGASEFRMFRRNVVKAVLSMSEKNRFSKGLFSWVGFNIKYIDYNADKRTTGKSKFKLKKQIDYATDGLINFSTKPLRLITITGVIISLISLIYLIIIFFSTIINGKDTPGYASLMCVILMLGGIELFVLGIIAEYIARIHIETKNRPIYIEKETLGFDDDIL